MPDPIILTPDPVELPRYVVYRLGKEAMQGQGGTLIRPEAIPAELYEALERALDGKPWRDGLRDRLA